MICTKDTRCISKVFQLFISILLSNLIIITADAQLPDIPGDTLSIMNSLDKAGKMVTTDPDSAFALAMGALNEAVEINYRQGKALAYELLGDLEQSSGQLSLALRNYFAALREYQWLNNVQKMAIVNLRIGDAYYLAGLYSKASEYYHKAVRLSQPDPGMIDQAYVLQRLGDSYAAIPDYHNALSFYKRLVDQKDEPDVMPVITKIIYCYQRLGRYDSALIYNQISLDIFTLQKDQLSKAYALNNIGYNYKYLGELDKAEKSFSEAVLLFQATGGKEPEYLVSIVNLGVIYQNTGNYEDAVARFLEAIEIADRRGDISESARIGLLLSECYYLQNDFYNALQYGDLALKNARTSGDHAIEASALLTLSKINTAFYDFELALDQYTEYLLLRDSLLLEQRMREERYMLLSLEGEKTEKEAEQYAAAREIQELARRELVMDTLKKRQQIEIQQKTIELQQAELTNQQLRQARVEQARMLAEERLAAEIKDREILELKITEQIQQDSIEEIDYQRNLAQSQNESLKKDNQLQQQALERVRARNRFLAGIFLLAILVLILLIIGLRYTRKTNRKLKDQRNKIQQQKEAIQSQYEIIDRERQKSDKLLLNILPEETASELKESGRATPRHYDKVSVIFTDFVGFTNIAEKLSPEEVVQELDNCFLRFDHIADKYNLEKIKTIGDSYMCAGGVPVLNDTNPIDAVRAALEIRDFMQELKKEKESRGEPYWQLRIGVNTGPVIAGVVGKNKFAYDIWGDAVNIASRMESSGEAGKVNISGETYNLVKDRFVCTYRGKVKAKNKGEIDMYFVESERK